MQEECLLLDYECLIAQISHHSTVLLIEDFEELLIS